MTPERKTAVVSKRSAPVRLIRIHDGAIHASGVRLEEQGQAQLQGAAFIKHRRRTPMKREPP